MWYNTYDNSGGQWIVDQLLSKNLICYKEESKLRNALIDEKVQIGKLKCNYCGKEILSVFDKWNNNKWWGYLGNQAKRQDVYNYSSVICLLRKLDGCENKVWNNNLYNVHARIHSKPIRDYSIICRNNSLRTLCNECFQKTYKRVKVYQKQNLHLWTSKVSHCEISVVESRNETIGSVLIDLGFDLNDLKWENK